MTRSLVIGAAGYVGRAIVSSVADQGGRVTGTSRHARRSDLIVANGHDLDRVLEDNQFDQVVVTAPLTGDAVDWVLERADGPRWLILSSAQVTSAIPAPGTERALARERAVLAAGAAVLRPTMVFGRGGDVNVSRVTRFIRRFHVALQIGDGSQLVQPVHVDDLSGLVSCHGRRPSGGIFDVGGDSAIPARCLLRRIITILGTRATTLRLPSSVLRQLAPLARAAGLRQDQVLRLDEDKTADIGPPGTAFNWSPQPLGDRLVQGIAEALYE